jgi:hypothetical protein
MDTLHADVFKLIKMSSVILLAVGNISNKTVKETKIYFILNNFFYMIIQKYKTVGQASDENVMRRLLFAR